MRFGIITFSVVLCHLMNVFCLPILLYGLEGVPLSESNLCTLHSKWNTLYRTINLILIRDLYNGSTSSVRIAAMQSSLPVSSPHQVSDRVAFSPGSVLSRD